MQGQRRALAIDGDGRRAGRIDADARDVLGAKAALAFGRPDGPAHRAIEALDVVGRILPGQVRVFRIQQDARLAARIVVDARGRFAAVGQIDHDGPHAVGPEIDADGEPSMSRRRLWHDCWLCFPSSTAALGCACRFAQPRAAVPHVAYFRVSTPGCQGSPLRQAGMENTHLWHNGLDENSPRR